MIQVAIVSPIPALRAGLSAMLAGDPDIRILAAVDRLGEPPDFLAEVRVLVATPGGIDLDDLPLFPDQALLLAGVEPEEAARELRTLSALDLRAWGILPPEATAEALQSAVRALAEGLIAADPQALRLALSEAPAFAAAGGETLSGLASADPDAPLDHLTVREGDVLSLLAEGLTNKQIALSLGISEHTVKFHVSSIYSKLAVSNRAEAVHKGAQKGWVAL